MVNRSETGEIAILAESLRRHLQRRQRAGIHILPNEQPDRAVTPDRAGESQHSARPESDLSAESPWLSAKNLDELRSEIGDCRRCKLCSGRKNIVFGIGNPHARLMFVGEGPGRDEDLQGEPFVGRAGNFSRRGPRGSCCRRSELCLAERFVVRQFRPKSGGTKPLGAKRCGLTTSTLGT